MTNLNRLRTQRISLESKELECWEKGEHKLAQQVACQVFATNMQIKRLIYGKDTEVEGDDKEGAAEEHGSSIPSSEA